MRGWPIVPTAEKTQVHAVYIVLKLTFVSKLIIKGLTDTDVKPGTMDRVLLILRTLILFFFTLGIAVLVLGLVKTESDSDDYG